MATKRMAAKATGTDEESTALVVLEYSKAQVALWESVHAIERIALSEIMIKASYGVIVVGNLEERVELTNGPGKTPQNPKGLWYCYRLEVLKPIPTIEDPDTGEVIDVKPGDYVLVPETNRLAALSRFIGCAIALRPTGRKPIPGKKSMWLYEGALISRVPLGVDGKPRKASIDTTGE